MGGGRHRAHYPATVYPWERETNIYSKRYICKISDLLLSEIKEKLTNLLNATFCFLIMHHTGTKASFSSKM